MRASSVPDIATLRAICHGDKLLKDRRSWYAYSRKLSIYITWLLIHTPVRANQVTAVSAAMAALGTLLLAMPPPWVALCGAAAFLVHHLLDKVDGDIARFRRSYSLRGVYLDEVGHSIAFGGLLLGLGFHLAWGASSPGGVMALLAAGALGGLAMVLGRHNKHVGFQLFAQYVLPQPELLPDPGPGRAPHVLSREAVLRTRGGEIASEGAERGRLLGRLRDATLAMTDFVLLIPLLTAGLIWETATGDARFLQVLLYGQAVAQVAVLLALIGINYGVNVESECRRLAQSVRNHHGPSDPG